MTLKISVTLATKRNAIRGVNPRFQNVQTFFTFDVDMITKSVIFCLQNFSRNMCYIVWVVIYFSDRLPIYITCSNYESLWKGSRVLKLYPNYVPYY